MNPPLWISLAVMIPVAAAQITFQAGTGEEEIKGKPKHVRLERQEIRDGNADAIAIKPHFVEETDYRPDGKLSGHRTYRPDGTLSICEVFEYDDQGRRTKITSYDEKNTPVQTQSFHWIEAGVEEETASASDGKQQERTIRRFDEHGRMVELKTVDSDKAAVQMTLRYDDLGRPVESRLIFKGENGAVFSGGTFTTGQQPAGEMAIRVEILYQSDKRAVITMYSPDGAIQAQMETNEEQAGREISQVLFDQHATDRETTTEQIDSSDSQGNWTKKTTLKRNLRTQADEPATILHRTIDYF